MSAIDELEKMFPEFADRIRGEPLSMSRMFRRPAKEDWRTEVRVEHTLCKGSPGKAPPGVAIFYLPPVVNFPLARGPLELVGRCPACEEPIRLRLGVVEGSGK